MVQLDARTGWDRDRLRCIPPSLILTVSDLTSDITTSFSIETSSNPNLRICSAAHWKCLIEISIHKPCADNCSGLRIEPVTIEKHIEKVASSVWPIETIERSDVNKPDRVVTGKTINPVPLGAVYSSISVNSLMSLYSPMYCRWIHWSCTFW